MNTETIAIKETKSRIFFRFLKFGLLAWGGPVAQIAMIKKELVEEEKWVTKEKFNRALSIYQALPGPEAHELCVYFGMIAGGRWGGFLAGLGFMLPGFILMMLLTWLYVSFGINSPNVQATFTGIHAAVIALIFTAVQRIGKHAIINKQLLSIAIASALSSALNISFYIILPFAGITYYFLSKKNKIAVILVTALYIFLSFNLISNRLENEITPLLQTQSNNYSSPPSMAGIFFTGLKGGLLTFGGAYTVIPFIQEDAVINQKWLTNKQFLDGLALSGILPAPLIIFTTFVGYFGGGWPGAFIITFGIFLPAFCFTLIGHRYIEKIIENKSLHDFLDGLTAGVIGLIAVTAIKLFVDTISDISTLIIFSLMLFVLYRFKNKFTVIFVIMFSGLCGYLLTH